MQIVFRYPDVVSPPRPPAIVRVEKHGDHASPECWKIMDADRHSPVSFFTIGHGGDPEKFAVMAGMIADRLAVIFNSPRPVIEVDVVVTPRNPKRRKKQPA